MLRQELEQIETRLAELPELIPSAQTHERIGFHGHAADPAWVQLDFGREVTPERIAIFPARVPAAKNPELNGFPAAFEVLISPTADFETSVRIVRWQEEAPGSGQRLPFLSFPGNGASGRFLRLQVTGFRSNPLRPGDEFFRIGEIVVLENGQNVALHPPLTRLPTSTQATINPRRWDWQNAADGRMWCLPLRGKPGSPKNGFHSELETRDFVDGESWVEVDLGQPMPIDEIHLVPAHPRDFPDAAGFGFPPRFWIVADPGTPHETELVEEASPPYPAEALPNPGAAPLIIATPDLKAQTIRLKCETLWKRGESFEGQEFPHALFLFALAELQIWHEGQNIALGKTVRYSDTTETSSWGAEALVDGYSSREALLDWETWLSQIEQAQSLETRAAAIREDLEYLRERAVERWQTISIAAVVITALLASIAILVLQTRSVRAREELRARIARDLHDEIGASLSHLAIQTHLAGQQLPEESEDRGRLAAISQSARDTFDNMRDIVWMLAPAGGSWEELAHRMESIANRLLQGMPHQVTREGEPPSGDPPMDWARRVVAILKESISNARRHSRADSIGVRIEWAEREFLLRVEDDGCGFDVDTVSTATGSGLANLRHRAEKLGGELEIASTPEAGTELVLRVPMSRFAPKNRHKLKS